MELKLLYENERIILPMLCGHRTINKDREIFNNLFKDEKFKDLDKREHKTLETEVVFYGLKERASFDEIFYSLSYNLDDLCLTQHQILKICEKYRKHLKPNYATFFLIKKKRFLRKSKYHVVFVGNHSGGLDAGVYNFENKHPWMPDDFYFVIPKLVISKLK